MTSPTTIAKTVTPIAPSTVPVHAKPIVRPRAARIATTRNPSRNEFRRLALIWP
jgi:hypothetical protein